MARTIYLAVLSNGPRPAHFSLFVPTCDMGVMGKVIHVTGNPATGFFLQFKRNYDLATSEYSKYQLIPISRPSEDTIARDRLESIATVVLPPGRSPNPFDPSMRAYVHKLVEEGLVVSSASVVVQNAPGVL
ncbi:hypothetical protein BDV59DRAFT_196569 [Aspergillus ambiguus]|uniref:uncharacterized protein n=1 Tax=Aspergillus ambiguus TaxID=176160 RepID=UPI003CCDFA8C